MGCFLSSVQWEAAGRVQFKMTISSLTLTYVRSAGKERGFRAIQTHRGLVGARDQRPIAGGV